MLITTVPRARASIRSAPSTPSPGFSRSSTNPRREIRFFTRARCVFASGNGARHQLRRRIYTFSKSIDDASSIGGGGVIVAQDPFDIAADRGLSSFNQTHKFTGNWIAELPFGENHRYLQRKARCRTFSMRGRCSGDFTIASGLWYTPRVLGNSLDIDRGVERLAARRRHRRADHALESVDRGVVQHRGILRAIEFRWHNEHLRQSRMGHAFGDAGRNIIKAQVKSWWICRFSKTITIKESRALELRIQAANIFNFINYSSINTIVNSLQFGQVTAAVPHAA